MHPNGLKNVGCIELTVNFYGGLLWQVFEFKKNVDLLDQLRRRCSKLLWSLWS